MERRVVQDGKKGKGKTHQPPHFHPLCGGGENCSSPLRGGDDSVDNEWAGFLQHILASTQGIFPANRQNIGDKKVDGSMVLYQLTFVYGTSPAPELCRAIHDSYGNPAALLSTGPENLTNGSDMVAIITVYPHFAPREVQERQWRRYLWRMEHIIGTWLRQSITLQTILFFVVQNLKHSACLLPWLYL